MKKIFVLLSCIIFQQVSSAQEFTLPLYPVGKVPNHQKTDETEKRDTTETIHVTRVQTPDMTVFLPSRRNATGQAVIICPGGGYSTLSFSWEGTDVAKLLNAKGIVGIVLKYRLPN